jgi:hypothetical protein
MNKNYIALVIFGSLVLSACTSAIQASGEDSPGKQTQGTDPETTPIVLETTDTLVESEETNIEIVFLPEEPPPSGAEREFFTDFSKHTIPYSEILSGGPQKDGIPAVDNPKFVSVSEANDWLAPEEPVIVVVVGDSAKAYPIQVLTWHEIVNDTVGDLPLTVTFCPLCNTGIAFERQFDGVVLDFGTSGRLRFSNLIMYDRQTETWWQQATGEGIAGELAGRKLNFYPAAMLGWEEFKNTYPDGLVLSRETGFNRSYGRNPYPGYDNINNSPFLFRGPSTPGELPAMARVLTVESGSEAVAYPFDLLQEVHVVNDTISWTEVVVFWEAGTSSALDAGTVAGGGDVGSANVFEREVDGQTLTFTWDGEKINDEETGSEWNLLGRAVSGPLEGTQLNPIVAINHFWFSWAAFKPETRIYQP